MKIGICDDNAILLDKYQNQAKNILCKHDLACDIYTFSNGEDVITAYKNDDIMIDILVLDILMRNLNGIETAKAICKINSKTIIIFLTSSEEFVFDTMDVNAYAYLMKNQMTEETFEHILMDAVAEISKAKEESLNFRKDGEVYQISYADISYIKIYNAFCYIHHWDGIIYESRDLSFVENLGCCFFKVHEQYILNLQYIGKIGKNEIMLADKSKNVIPFDKALAKDIKLRFAEYMMNKL